MNEYILEKTGLTLEAQEFTHKMKELFDYNSCSLTEAGLKFHDVKMKVGLKRGEDEVLKEGQELKSLEIRKNGWINVCENEESYLITNYELKESFLQQNMFGYERFPNVNAIQMGAMTDLQKVISTVKRLSIEDANHLKSIMGPSLEEKILRTIIDACLFDTPPANGLQNGV